MSTERDPVFGCVLWTGRKDKDGYGYHGRSRAHIVAFEAVNGPVPDGLVVDHGCRRRACCFEPHLEAVTKSENERRKSWKYRAKRTKCKRGHDMTTAMVSPEGGRICRTCNQEAGART